MTNRAAQFAAVYAALTASHEVARFVEQIDVRGADDCWPWKGGLLDQGYGRFHSDGTSFRAHRLAYQMAVGPIPDAAHLDHTCHNRDEKCPGGAACLHRRCCNPHHLEPTSLVQNVMRGKSDAAGNARKTHCKRGHEFTPENTRMTSAGKRRCMACSGLNGRGQGSHERAKTHCPQGHPYDERNTYYQLKPDGTVKCRVCRACRRQRARGKSQAMTSTRGK